MLRFTQFIKTIILEAKLEHFVHLNLDPENEHHNELLTAFNNNKERLTKKHPAQYKSIEDLANAVSHYIKSPEVAGATLIHHNKETGAKVYHIHTDEAACKLSSDTWCTSKGGFPSYDEGRSFIFHFPNEPDRNLRKIGYFGGGQYKEPTDSEDISNNFQDASNKPLSLKHWSSLRKKHNLDNIPDLEGLRGIPETPAGINIRVNHLHDKIKSLTTHDDPDSELGKILENKDINSTHIDAILSHNKPNFYNTLMFGGFLHPKHIDQLIDDKNNTRAHEDIVRTHYKLTPLQITKIVNNPNSIRAHNMLVKGNNNGSLHLSDDNINTIINHPNSHEAVSSLMYGHYTGGPKLSQQQMDAFSNRIKIAQEKFKARK